MSRDGSPKKTADEQSGSGRPEGIPGEADIGREVGQVGDFRRHHDGPCPHVTTLITLPLQSLNGRSGPR